MFQDLKIIDFHSHFPNAMPGREERTREMTAKVGERRMALLREQALAYNREWRLAWDFPEPERERPSDEVQADRWHLELERYGIDWIVWVTGGGNDRLAKVVAMYPRKFIGFAHHEPFEEGAAEELERAVTELGFRGYKVLAPALDRPIADEAAFPVWEMCAKHEIPVLIHFGIMGAGGGIADHINISPLSLHDAAKAFPDVNFVVPHFGCGHIRDTLMLCWACRNVYVDTSGSNQWVRWVPGDVTVKSLFRKYLETIGPDRILFGTDSSWFPRGFAIRYLRDQIRDCRELGLSHEALQKIFGGNAARLLKIEL